MRALGGGDYNVAFIVRHTCRKRSLDLQAQAVGRFDNDPFTAIGENGQRVKFVVTIGAAAGDMQRQIAVKGSLSNLPTTCACRSKDRLQQVCRTIKAIL